VFPFRALPYSGFDAVVDDSFIRSEPTLGGRLAMPPAPGPGEGCLFMKANAPSDFIHRKRLFHEFFGEQPALFIALSRT
jgi:hypothetical protein